jgi:predicted permease
VPGVISVSSAMTVHPSDWGGRVSIFYPGEEPAQDFLRGHEFELGIRVDINPVAPKYFRTLGIPILQGRDFTENDGANASPRDQDGNPLENQSDSGRSLLSAQGVVIVSHKLAERLWPGENAVGKRLLWPSIVGPPRPPLEVVGVAADTKYRALVGDSPLLMYVPLFQNYDGRPTLVVRTASDPIGLSAAIRLEINSLDKNLPVFRIKTMQQQMAISLWQQRTATSLVSVFGVLALLLASIGLYGVVAHYVAQRTQEIGIRMAMGAGPRDILKLVVGRGMSVVLVGLAAGFVVSLFLTRILSSFLYEVSPTDPTAFAAVALLLAAVTLAASYLPARQATIVDPLVALRHE